MEHLAPVGGVYQAGTLSGNPLAVAAGLAMLQVLRRDNPYQALEVKADKLAKSIASILSQKGVAHTINRVGSMLSLFFNPGPVTCYTEVLQSDKEAFRRFFAKMLDQGIYLAPSPFEAWFVGASHSDEDLDRTLEAVRKGFA